MEKNEILKDIVKNTAKFSYAESGKLFYSVSATSGSYMFPVDMNNKEDVGTATFNAEEKGMTLMRYIRKAMDKGSLVKDGNPCGVEPDWSEYADFSHAIAGTLYYTVKDSTGKYMFSLNMVEGEIFNAEEKLSRMEDYIKQAKEKESYVKIG